jgi:transposase
MKKFRHYDPEQINLLPTDPRTWLPEDHLIFFIEDVVGQLDLSPFIEPYQAEERGYPPYHPAMMVRTLLYAYCLGVFSSRRIECRLQEDVAFRVLSGNNQPDFRTIATFRKRHLESLKQLFPQVLELCSKAGLVKLGHVSLDGTKVNANASRHKAMSYGRMKTEEAKLEAEVRAMLEEAERVDAEEDARYGDRRGDELPEELARRETRLKRIREAMAALEERAGAETEGKDEAELERGTPPVNGTDGRDAALPRDKDQYNFTDPESRIMPSSANKKAFVQAYNAQLAVDAAHQIIIACDTSNCSADTPQLAPMVVKIEENTGTLPDRLSADAGYFSDGNLELLESLHVDAYIPPQRQKHTTAQPPVPRGRIPKSLSRPDRMRRKLSTKRGKKLYSRRKAIVEPAIGQIKQARGFRQFLLRGAEATRAEWSLVCMTHNVLRWYEVNRRAT